MIFTKEFLQAVVNEDTDDTEVIKDSIVDKSRWAIQHECIFKYQNKYYITYYERGATEQQWQEPYEYDDDNIECTEVHQVERVVTVWEAI